MSVYRLVQKITGPVMGVLLFALPSFVFAFPFGGQIGAGGFRCESQPAIVFCWNNRGVWVSLGGPIGGPYAWTPATQTYLFGPPSHVGQWILGLASVPFYCVASRSPVIVCPGSFITMMGSSR